MSGKGDFNNGDWADGGIGGFSGGLYIEAKGKQPLASSPELAQSHAKVATGEVKPVDAPSKGESLGGDFAFDDPGSFTPI